MQTPERPWGWWHKDPADNFIQAIFYLTATAGITAVLAPLF